MRRCGDAPGARRTPRVTVAGDGTPASPIIEDFLQHSRRGDADGQAAAPPPMPDLERSPSPESDPPAAVRAPREPLPAIVAAADRQLRDGRLDEAERTAMRVFDDPAAQFAPSVAAGALQVCAVARSWRGDFTGALECSLRAISLFETAQDLPQLARALSFASIALARLGQPEQAIQFCVRATEESERAADEPARARVLHNLGVTYAVLNDFARAVETTDAARAIDRRLGNDDLHWLATCNGARYRQLAAEERQRGGETAAAQAGYAEVAQLAADGLRHYTTTNNVPMIVQCAITLGMAECKLGRHAAARGRLTDALALAERHGNPWHAATVRRALGVLERDAGDDDAAITLLDAAARAFDALGDHDELITVMTALTDLHEAGGRYREALACARRLHAMTREQSVARAKANGQAIARLVAFERQRTDTDVLHRRAADLEAANLRLSHEAAALNRHANEDELTGLGNRRYLDLALKQAFAARDGAIALAVVDVDGFKRINDSYSHVVGDDVLRVIADLLRDNCRESDAVARFGGDEYVLVLAAGDERAGEVAERVRAAIAAYPWSGVADGLAVTVSVGVACRAGEAAPAELMAAADACLYAAKAQGKDRVVARVGG
jgi:diguanylate cyclase (GGDEF)-like protein